MSEQANVALVQSVYDAFRSGDIPTILNHLDPQADLNFEGPSAIPWAGNRQGDNVAAVGRYQARVKLTGKRIDSPLVHLWTIRNGKVVRCQELTDTATEAAACTAGVVAR
jgi:uncharacterized protein